MVRRKIKNRWTIPKLFLPVGKRGLQHVSLQPPALAHSEIRVLKSKGGKRGQSLPGESLVQRPKFPKENLHRPTVTDDLVRRKKKQVLFFS